MTMKRYTTGFVLCLLLTMASFGIVREHVVSGHQLPNHAVLLAGILAFAILQLIVQLIFFLHIGRGSAKRDIAAFAFALTLIGIVVGGSLWIMTNLTHSQQVPFYDSTVSAQQSTD